MKARAEIWLKTLVSATEYANARLRHGVLSCDIVLQGRPVRYVAVIPDEESAFPRARGGEVGLLQGWALAETVREAIAADAGSSPRDIVSLVDVPSQAYGRTEEALCISLALAAAVDAYATARMSGHASVALILGNAFSGGLLAHGYQASRILALDSPSVQIQAMGRAAAMRVMRRTEQELDKAAADVPPMAYDLEGFSRLEILHATVSCSDVENPSQEDGLRTRQALAETLELARHDGPYLAPRLRQQEAGGHRSASRVVRKMMQEMWAPNVQEQL